MPLPNPINATVRDYCPFNGRIIHIPKCIYKNSFVQCGEKDPVTFRSLGYLVIEFQVRDRWRFSFSLDRYLSPCNCTVLGGIRYKAISPHVLTHTVQSGPQDGQLTALVRGFPQKFTPVDEGTI